MFIPPSHDLSQSRVSCVHCAMTVSVAHKLFGGRIDVSLIVKHSAPKTGLPKSRSTDSGVLKGHLEIGLEIQSCLWIDAIWKTGQWISLGVLTDCIILRNIFIAKAHFHHIYYDFKMVHVAVHRFPDHSLILQVWLHLLAPVQVNEVSWLILDNDLWKERKCLVSHLLHLIAGAKPLSIFSPWLLQVAF